MSSWVSSVLLDLTAEFGLKQELHWQTLTLEQFKFLSNILFTSMDMFIKKTIFKKKKCLFLFCGYIPHKYKHKSLFLDFYFPFCWWPCEAFCCDLDQWCSAKDSQDFSFYGSEEGWRAEQLTGGLRLVDMTPVWVFTRSHSLISVNAEMRVLIRGDKGKRCDFTLFSSKRAWTDVPN